jgi:putative Holliday junction resolvase
MPALILPLAEAAAHLPARGALIGLDLGTKTIGVAASDPDRRLAAAVETIARKTFSADAARLLVLAAERQAVAFVLGLPINMDGSEGPRAQSTRAFDRASDRVLGRTAVHRGGRARADRGQCHARPPCQGD